MYILKAILIIYSIISLCRTLTEKDTGKAFSYLFDATLTGMLGILIKPI